MNGGGKTSGARAGCTLLWLVLTGLGASAAAQAAIDVDGRLDEPEWQAAKLFDEFVSIDPLTREPGPYRTEARVLALPEGLAVGITAMVPRAMRTYGRSTRDAARMDADPARIVVDFEGTGRVAYEFTVSLSNSIRDGIILNQNQASYDWDGTWEHAVTEDDRAWYVEVLLPWTVAPTAAGKGDTRTIGLWLVRFVKQLGRGYGFPAINLGRPTFVSDLHKLTVRRYAARSLDVFPYVSGTHDRLAESTLGRAGVDLTWKPNGQSQLTATLNPDFGQVESDDLVVNFTAVETFFSEKRPFFTENQSLFDLRMPTEGRLVNTRRIGAAPDAGAAGTTELTGAVKLSTLAGPWELGGFAALEDDTSAATGRSYFALRGRWRGDGLAAGWLGTLVERPERDRRAQTHALDLDWFPGNAVSVRGQLLASLIDAPGARDGLGGWVQFKRDPGTRLAQEYELLLYDRNLDLNDLGFLPRRSLHQARGRLDFSQREYAEGSRLIFSRWSLEGTARENDLGQRLTATLRLEREFRYRHPHGLTLRTQYDSNGLDDLITRGRGPVRVPGKLLAGAAYGNNARKDLRFEGDVELRQEGLDDRVAYQLTASPQYIFTPNLSATLSAIWIDSPDWLALRSRTRELGQYSRRQLTTRLALNWFPGARSELRARLQWVAVRARGIAALRNDAAGTLVPLGRPAASFSQSELGMQLRYRYELAPLSDLYLVYSRGGFALRADTAEDFGGLWSDALDEANAEQFVVKVRYRF